MGDFLGELGYSVGPDVIVPSLPGLGYQPACYQGRLCHWGDQRLAPEADGYEITALGAPEAGAAQARCGWKAHEAHEAGTPWGAAAAPVALPAAEWSRAGAVWHPSQGSRAVGHGIPRDCPASPAEFEEWLAEGGGGAEGAAGCPPQSLAEWVAHVGPPGSGRPRRPSETEAEAGQDEPECLAALRKDILECCGFMRVAAIHAARRRRARRATYQYATSLEIFVSGLSEEGGRSWRGPLLLGMKSILDCLTDNTCQIRNDKLYVTDATRDAVVHVTFSPFAETSL